jgi:hypothetical protein
MPNPLHENQDETELTKAQVERAHAKVLLQKPGYQAGTIPHRITTVPVTDESMASAETPEIIFTDPHTNKRIQYPVIGGEEEGRPFYFARVKTRKGTDWVKTRIYLLDENQYPQTKLEFRDKGILSPVIDDYTYLTGKEGGAQIQQGIGGQYEMFYAPKPKPGEPLAVDGIEIHRQTILFKQDKKGPVIHHSKNIAEYVAGRIKNFFGGESAATVFYGSYVGGGNELPLPDKSGNNVYIGSLYYDGFQDLFKDIKRVNGETLHQPVRSFKTGFRATEHELIGRPRFVGSYPPNRKAFLKGTVDPETGEARIDNLETVFAIDAIVGDFDVHGGNIGVLAERTNIPNPHDPNDTSDFRRDEDGDIILNENDKLGVAVSIDHGAAMEGLEDEVHMHGYRSPLTRNGLRPTNHFREYLHELHISKPFAEEIDRMATLDFGELDKVIDDSLKETAAFYGAKPLSEFAERIGVKLPADMKKTLATFDGTQSNKEDVDLKNIIIDMSKSFLKTKMRKRMESMKNMALDIKISLCIEKVSATEYRLIPSDEPPGPPFNLQELISENYQYFMKRFQNNDFHLRKSDQKVVLEMLTNLKSVPMHATLDAAWRVLRGALGAKKIDSESDYAMSFYQGDVAKGKQNMLLPKGVTHIRITKKECRQQHPELYAAQKKKAPNLSSDINPKLMTLDANEFGVNYLDSKRDGERAYYIESLTPDNKYQITAHQKPPEINPRYIFSDLIRKYCGEDFISVNPSIFKEVKNICAKMDVRHMSDDNKFGIVNDTDEKTLDEQEILLSVLDKALSAGISPTDPDRDVKMNARLDVMVLEMQTSYEKATTLVVKDTPRGDLTLPSKAYLEYAQAMCDHCILRNGKSFIIDILPDTTKTPPGPAEDPLLAQAYKIVCKKSGYRFLDSSGCNLLKGEDLKAAAAEARKILGEEPAPPRPARKP